MIITLSFMTRIFLGTSQLRGQICGDLELDPKFLAPRWMARCAGYRAQSDREQRCGRKSSVGFAGREGVGYPSDLRDAEWTRAAKLSVATPWNLRVLSGLDCNKER
jgi:hypothetical protein